MDQSEIRYRRSCDKFYTKRPVVDQAVSILADVMAGLGAKPEKCVAIEPSAGDGAFLESLRGMRFAGIRAGDIAPESPDVEEKDFLSDTKVADPLGRDVVVVGNPPFGKRSGSAIAFINHAIDHGATLVAFILPVQMRKWASQKAVSANTCLIADHDLPSDAFTLAGTSYDVRCCFQIWAPARTARGMRDRRIRVRPSISHPDFTMYQYNRTPQAEWTFETDWDFAVLRQGYGDYTIRHTKKRDLDRKKQWIFFKAHSREVLGRLLSIDFDALSRTNTSVRGFGKTEVVSEYRRVFEGMPDTTPEQGAV